MGLTGLLGWSMVGQCGWGTPGSGLSGYGRHMHTPTVEPCCPSVLTLAGHFFLGYVTHTVDTSSSECVRHQYAGKVDSCPPPPFFLCCRYIPCMLWLRL